MNKGIARLGVWVCLVGGLIAGLFPVGCQPMGEDPSLQEGPLSASLTPPPTQALQPVPAPTPTPPVFPLPTRGPRRQRDAQLLARWAGREKLDLVFDSPVWPAGAWTALPETTTLELEITQVKTLPDGFLSHVPKLQSLHLKAPELVRLPEDFLSHAPQLSEFILEADVLTRMPEGAWHHWQNQSMARVWYVVVPDGGPVYETPAADPQVSAQLYPGQRLRVRDRQQDEMGALWLQVEVYMDQMWTAFFWVEADRTMPAGAPHVVPGPVVQGPFPSRAAYVRGAYHLRRTGPTVTARISLQPDPSSLPPDTGSGFLFTVPQGWRPAQTIVWEVAQMPDDPAGTTESPPARLSLTVEVDGMVRYRAAGGGTSLGPGHQTIALAWPVAGAQPDLCSRPESIRETILKALSAPEGSRLPCEAVTWSQLAQIRELSVGAGHPEHLAGLTGLQQVRLVLGGGIGLPGILAQMPQVRIVKDLEVLSPDLLASVPQVQRLTLASSHLLRSLPPGFLDHTPHLESLILNGSDEFFPYAQLRLLPKGLLAPVPHLTHLEIASIRLERLPWDFLDSSSQLQSLTLETFQLEQLPFDFLSGVPRLTALTLLTNQALHLSPDLLVPVPRLHTLELTTLSSVPLAADFLTPVPRLRSLRLWHGQKTPLPVDFLAPVPRLRELELLTSWGRATNVLIPMQVAMDLSPPAFWAQVPELTTLTLWPGPALPALPPDFLAPLSHLTTLSLKTFHTERGWGPEYSRTQPLGLPSGLWDQAPQLRNVFLDGEFRPEDRPASRLVLQASREIKPEVLQAQAELVTHLTLTGSHWSPSVPRDLLAHFPQLTHLALRPGLLADLPRDALAQTPRLTHLTLLADDVTDLLPDLLTHAPTLTRLSLQADGLTALPSDFRLPAPGLTHLTLRADSLTTLPAGFLNGNPDLTHLTLEANALTALPAGFLDGNPDLTHLTLEANTLTTLPAAFLQQSPKLTHLVLQADGLMALPEAFLADTEALTQLTLQAEGLRALPLHFLAHPSDLTHLSLQGNQLESLPATFLQEVPRLIRLVLQVYGMEAPPPGFQERLTAIPFLDLQFRPPIPEALGLG